MYDILCSGCNNVIGSREYKKRKINLLLFCRAEADAAPSSLFFVSTLQPLIRFLSLLWSVEQHQCWLQILISRSLPECSSEWIMHENGRGKQEGEHAIGHNLAKLNRKIHHQQVSRCECNRDHINGVFRPWCQTVFQSVCFPFLSRSLCLSARSWPLLKSRLFGQMTVWAPEGCIPRSGREPLICIPQAGEGREGQRSPIVRASEPDLTCTALPFNCPLQGWEKEARMKGRWSQLKRGEHT